MFNPEVKRILNELKQAIKARRESDQEPTSQEINFFFNALTKLTDVYNMDLLTIKQILRSENNVI